MGRCLDFAAVYQTEIDDIDRNLGVITGPHLFPNQRLEFFVGRVRRQVGCGNWFLAEGIGIGTRDAEKAALEVNGETAAHRLCNVYERSGLEIDLHACGHDDRAHVAK